VTNGQRKKQHGSAKAELPEDHLDGAESTQGELDEQEPRSPQDREEIEAQQARSADRAVLC
jgi:hypothetical protein